MASPTGPICLICRRRFRPDPRSRGAQRLCGQPACRRARNNALARARRRRDIDDARAEERERQRRCRLARRLAASPTAPPTPPTVAPARQPALASQAAPCHAQPDAQKRLDSLGKSFDSLRRQVALSRDTFLREIAQIQGAIERFSAASGP